MAEKKKKRQVTLFMLKSSESAYFKIKKHSSGTKNKKIELMKYDPVLRKRVKFISTKVK